MKILVFSLILAAASWAQNLKGQLTAVHGVEDYRLLVKFSPSGAPDLESDGSLRFRKSEPLAESPARQKAAGLRYRRAVNFTADELRRIRAGEAAAAKPSSHGHFDILRFSGLFYVDAPELDKTGLIALGRELEGLDEVEYCSLEPVQAPPPPDPFDVPDQADHDKAPVTPLYTSQQGWLGPNPGVDCRYGWTVGADGYGVTVRDIEDSWGSLKHEDFPWDSLAYVLPAYNNTYDDHGMAIFGMIFGQHNNYGIEGCAPRGKGRAYSFQTSATQQNRTNAMTRMVADALPGDVILLEMQGGGLANDTYAPADVSQAIWDLTKQATDKGVIVVGTAGNGTANLDGSAYASYRARGDNGVIMAGAGNSTTHMRQLGSYGRCCLHVQGWGHNIVTSGYASLAYLANDSTQRYSSTFGGTSGAGGMTAGVVAALQSYAKKNLGRPLAPREMRTLLISTGTPQGSDSLTYHLGPLPNIRAAIAGLNVLGLEAKRGEPGGWRLERDGLVAGGVSKGRVELVLTDLSGRTRYRGRVEAAFAGSARVPVPGLSPGVYFLSVRGEGMRRLERHVLFP